MRREPFYAMLVTRIANISFAYCTSTLVSAAPSLRTYGASVDELLADFGHTVSQAALEKALQAKQYKLVCFAHVETSTAVLSDAEMISETVKRLSPRSLVCVQSRSARDGTD